MPSCCDSAANNIAVAAGKFASGCDFAAEAFERRQRGGELGDELGGGGQFAVGQVGTRIGTMQIGRSLRRNLSSCARKFVSARARPATAGTRTRPAQDRAFERGDGVLVSCSRAAAVGA